MEKLSDEELVHKIMYELEYVTTEKIQEIKTELLSRLSAGRRAIEAMEKIISIRKEITGFKDRDYCTMNIIAEYEQAKEKL